MKLLVLALSALGLARGGYNVGVGRGDVTGPAAEIGMMGYAKQGQNTKGIHTRLFSRAFIIEDVDSGSRVVFVSVDEAMMGQLVKLEVIARLSSLFPGVYTEQNIVLSATHTHSGPAGFMQYVLFNIPNLGFVGQTLEAMVAGIVESISRAHTSLRPGRVYHSVGVVEEEASINRSPTSYEANPEEEKARYSGNLDKELVQLSFYDDKGIALGVLNWFSVHPNSMNNTNHFISGDNKGAASLMFEKAMDPGSVSRTTSFVAAFASTNLGDVSPNTMGPRCIDTGLPCDTEHSTCDGRTQMCIASGPGKDMFESTKIIAERQFKKSFEMFSNPDINTELSGPIQFIHQWVDMSSYQVSLNNGSMVSTCKPALGYSFAAGTTDGPGEFDFTQGAVTGNPFWDFISGLLKDPSPETEACHAPKPILLDTGEYRLPFAWHPTSVDTQILRVGKLAMLAVPGEFTTMSGRRLREAVARAAAEEGEEMSVVIAGLSNTYTHYITTYEEYQKQRYEAASTIYGPHTLSAYLQQYQLLVQAMLKGEDVPKGPPPPDLSDQEISFVPGVVMDNPPPGYTFGDCVNQPVDSAPGQRVSASFVSGHLRNNLMLEDTFMTVEMLNEDEEWVVIAEDSDWETLLEWRRTNVILGESEVSLSWDIPQDAVEGLYRFGHKGYHHTILRGNFYYEGWSSEFLVGKGVRDTKLASDATLARKPWDTLTAFFGLNM
jgi:neutral ceramidase